MRPTLLILAAGLGSRYGGLKQMDGVGCSGETIMEYSVYDAIRAGFGKVVFVIRHSFADQFKEFVNRRFADKIEVEIVFQELNYLPEGYQVPEGREKPWGTNHAVLMAKEVIREPFCVINADDFYGQNSFGVIAEFLRQIQDKKRQYAMVGFRIQNTLSESGTVSRGVCQADMEHFLTSIHERTAIQRYPDRNIKYQEQDGSLHCIPENTPVSMNFWGFTPDYFDYSEQLFKEFLNEQGRELKSEFFIPKVIDSLIREGDATVKILDTESQWFGVTYKEDKPVTVAKIAELVAQGIYPQNLWE